MRTAYFLAAALAVVAPVCGATFRLGSNTGGFGGATSGSLTVDGVTLQLTADPAGAVLDERGSGGLGVNSRELPGVVGGEVDKFDVISGATPLAGIGESVELRFSSAGTITAIDFDGVKDESLEYFVLTSSSGARVNFFDSAANLSVPGVVDAALGDGGVTGDVVYLREDGPLDDEITGLAIPVLGGDVITITYAELGPSYGPLQAPNGARFQGITFAVPEPATLAGLLVAFAVPVARCRTTR